MSLINANMFVCMLIGLMGGVIGAFLMFKFIVFYRRRQPHTLYLLVAPFVFIGVLAGISAFIFFSLKAINILNGDSMLAALMFCALPIFAMVLYLASRSDSQWKAWTNRKDT